MKRLLRNLSWSLGWTCLISNIKWAHKNEGRRAAVLLAVRYLPRFAWRPISYLWRRTIIYPRNVRAARKKAL